MPAPVSITGIRKCKILSYTTAVLVPLQYLIATMNEDLLWNYDRWTFRFPVADVPDFQSIPGYTWTWNGRYGNEMSGWAHGAGNGFRYFVAMCFDVLIMIPFSAFLFGVLVRFFYYLQNLVTKYTGLSYWITVMLFLPPFLVLETFCCLRPQFVNWIRAVTTNGCIAPNQDPMLDITAGSQNAGNNVYLADFSWVRGVYILWALLNKQVDDQTPWKEIQTSLDYHFYKITPTVAIDVC